jgi:hypothetical protein
MKTALLALAVLCQDPVQQLHLPGTWTQSVRDGVVSYRSARATEAVTAAAYQLHTVVDETARLDLVRRSVELGLAAERRWGGARLRLSAIGQHRVGALVQQCYAGEDPATGRRFISVTLASAQVLQHVYYEAFALSAESFERQARLILAGQAPARANWRAGRDSGTCCRTQAMKLPSQAFRRLASSSSAMPPDSSNMPSSAVMNSSGWPSVGISR